MLQKKIWELVVIFIAEVLGTAALMLFGCMTGVVFDEVPNILQPALGWGFVVGTIGMMIGHISEAHLNPAITLAAFIFNRISLLKVFIYFAAEMIGAILGYGALLLITPYNNTCTTNDGCTLCVTKPHGDVNIYQALVAEFFATSFLVYAACGTWDPRNSSKIDSTPIKFSLCIAALVIAVGPYTSASMNPARSFAPALITWYWKDHWLYWVGPIGGSLFSSLFYKYVFLPPTNTDQLEQIKDIRDQSRVIHSMEEASINIHRDDIS